MTNFCSPTLGKSKVFISSCFCRAPSNYDRIFYCRTIAD